MKKMIKYGAIAIMAIALCGFVTGCSSPTAGDIGSSTTESANDTAKSGENNSASSTAEVTKSDIVGTWEGELIFNRSSRSNSVITYTLSFTYKEDGTYTHVLTPNLTTHTIGPGTWALDGNYVKMIPTSDPDEGMRAKYDAKAKTLSWTEADSGSTSITMTKKSSSGSGDSNNNGGSTGNGTPVADPKVGALGVNITTPVLPASVGENILAGKTYSGEEQDNITFNTDGTGTYQMWESSVGYTYWKIRYSYDNTNKILSLYPTEIKGPDGEYHDFAYYKSKYENATIEEPIKACQKQNGTEQSGKMDRLTRSSMIMYASKMLPKEPVTTSDSDEKIARAFQKGLLTNLYAVYFGNVQKYYLKDWNYGFVLYADYEHTSNPEAFRAFNLTPRVSDGNYKVTLKMDTQRNYRFYNLHLQINSAECDYAVKEITNDCIKVMYIPTDSNPTDLYFNVANPEIPYTIVTPSDENYSDRNKVVKLTINGTDYELVNGDAMQLYKQ